MYAIFLYPGFFGRRTGDKLNLLFFQLLLKDLGYLPVFRGDCMGKRFDNRHLAA